MAELTAADVQRFHEEGRQVLQDCPDLSQRLEAMGEAGFKINNAALGEIIRERRYDVIRHIISKEGLKDAHAFTNAKDDEARALAEYHRTAEKLDRQKPFQKYERKLDATDKYLEQRRQEKRNRR